MTEAPAINQSSKPSGDHGKARRPRRFVAAIAAALTMVLGLTLLAAPPAGALTWDDSQRWDYYRQWGYATAEPNYGLSVDADGTSITRGQFKFVCHGGSVPVLWISGMTNPDRVDMQERFTAYRWENGGLRKIDHQNATFVRRGVAPEGGTLMMLPGFKQGYYYAVKYEVWARTGPTWNDYQYKQVWLKADGQSASSNPYYCKINPPASWGYPYDSYRANLGVI